MTHLHDFHRGKVTRLLQERSVSAYVKAIGQDAERLALARRPPAAKLLKAGDELGYLLRTEAASKADELMGGALPYVLRIQRSKHKNLGSFTFQYSHQK